jgi:hypothetical protein
VCGDRGLAQRRHPDGSRRIDAIASGSGLDSPNPQGPARTLSKRLVMRALRMQPTC